MWMDVWSPRTLEAGTARRRGVELQRWYRVARQLAGLAFVLAAGVACGDEEPFHGVTYDEDIRPIFNRRCTTCHRPGGPSGVDIRNPFSTEDPPNVGLARARTQWKVRNPSLDIPEFDVKQGEPENSFLIHKISDPSLGLLPEDPDGVEGPEVPPAGSPMPLQVPPLNELEVQLLEDWVFAGAPNGEFMDRGDRLEPQQRLPQLRSFAADVRPLFGVEEGLNQVNGVCRPGQDGICARCVYCHYEGTPNPPNLSDPFGPDGVVGITSVLRPDMKRVEPGDPEASLLIHKIRSSVEQEYGARMPYSFPRLSEDQVALVSQWIEDGARR